MAPVDESELKLIEERLARVGVLQELTVAALDLFDPRRSMDEFLDRLSMRLGCCVAICVADADEGTPARLLGAAGLSRTSRGLPLASNPGGLAASDLQLPYPELARAPTSHWRFRVLAPQDSGRGGAWLLLFFDGGVVQPEAYRGVVERLVDILRTALLHRQLYARTIESERRLYEQKTLLECQSEAALDGILFVATDGAVNYNRRFAEIFGLPRPHVPLREVTRRMAEVMTHAERVLPRIERLIASRDEQLRSEVRMADGRVFDASCVPIKSADGIYYGRGWYFRDITDHIGVQEQRARLFAQEQAARTQAEEARRRSEFLAEVSRLLATSLDFSVTLERVARMAIPTFADWCAVDILEEDGSVNRVAVAHVSEQKTELIQQLRAHYTPNLSGSPGISRALRHGKTEFYPQIDTELRAQIARDARHLELLEKLGSSSALIVPLTARGRRLGAIALVYGDSGRIYSPEDVALAEDLALRAALAVDNARLYTLMEEAVRAREEFLSIASHELRTPVTSLHLAVQGLLRQARTGGLASAPAGFLASSLETAERQSGRMTQLIDRLLDVSRINAGRLELRLESVDLAAVVRELVAQSASDLVQAGCALRLEADEPVVGRWDRARVEQVFANLLSNAIKYGAGKPIEIRVERVNGRARLSVLDHGIGIPPERLTRIFERFERAVSAHHYSGLGLGLYIVRRVLEALGGSVRVESRPGEGAHFQVELPIEGPTSAESTLDGRRGVA